MSFIKYKLYKDPITKEVNIVNKVYSDHTISIPFVDGNRHYQEYLDWVAEGNTAEAAD